MPTTTPRLGLLKKVDGEYVDVETDLAENFDKIDAAMNGTLCTSGTRPATPWTGQRIIETDTLKELLWDGSLSQLEDQHPQHFVRIHRNTLAQRQAMRQLKLCPQSDGSEGWLLQLESCTEWLPVSRRQLPIVRQALQNL